MNRWILKQSLKGLRRKLGMDEFQLWTFLPNAVGELLPPPRTAQWDFAKAYLGSARLGELLLEFPNVTRALCGHSHFPAEATVGHIRATNVGSGYRWKTFLALNV